MSKIRQHEALRVPQGWNGQDKAFVIQLERVLTDLYRLFGILDDTAVKGIAYDSATHNLTVTIGGETEAVTKIAILDSNNLVPSDEIPLAADGARGGVQIGYTQDGKKYPLKLSGEKGYVEVPWTDTLNTAGVWDRMDRKLYLVASETQGSAAATNTNRKVYIGTDNCLYSNDAKVLTDHQDISGKADKVSGATADNFAALDASGNLTDSGHKHSDYLTEHQDISGKADKATTVTSVDYDSGNKKITKTINGTTTDVVAVSAIKADLGAFTWGQLANQS